MSKVINGKKPLSSKKSPSLSTPSFFKDKLTISDELKAEIAAQGKEYRFISYKKYIDDGNLHSKGWVVYKPKTTPAQDSFAFGVNPDGIIRRGDAVLAVRDKERCEEHRAYNRERAERMRGFKKAKAQELRSMAREARLDANVIEGYEENE